MRSGVTCGALALCILLSPAFAQDRQVVAPVPGYTYFNRPGATLEQQQADLTACRPAVSSMTQPFPGMSSYEMSMAGSYGLGGVLGAAAVVDQQHRVAMQQAMHANYENCMVVRGWRVLQLEERQGREIDRLRGSALAERLATMVGAEDPPGTVARTYAVQESLAANLHVDKTSLSLQLMPEEFLLIGRSIARVPMGAATSEQLRARGQERRDQRRAAREQLAALRGSPEGAAMAVTVEALNSIPAGQGVVVLAVGANATFVRVDAPEDTGADVIPPILPDSKSGETAAPFAFYVVPEGRWRLTTLSGGQTSFCLGAPNFELAAGDVVFVGSFLGGEGDALEQARAALAMPAPALAESLRVAPYVNGDTFECGGDASYLYAYEIEGAPFREGYVWGSVASVAVRED